MSTPLPPLDWPHYGIGFIPAVKRGFQKYATFSGRASRSEFWWWALANVIVVTVLYVLMFVLAFAGRTPDGEPGMGLIVPTVLLVVFALAVVIPTIAVTVRRLHDAGYTGWFYLFNVVGLGVVTLVLCAMETSPTAGRYGPPQPQGYGPGAYGNAYGAGAYGPGAYGAGQQGYSPAGYGSGQPGYAPEGGQPGYPPEGYGSGGQQGFPPPPGQSGQQQY
jgi:uncharacterized membrane protein YhaH (DUF805 family)